MSAVNHELNFLQQICNGNLISHVTNILCTTFSTSFLISCLSFTLSVSAVKVVACLMYACISAIISYLMY